MPGRNAARTRPCPGSTLTEVVYVTLMDERFGAIDAVTREAMQNALAEIWNATRKTVLFITHDIREAVFLSDRILVLAGRPSRIVLDSSLELPRPRGRHDARFQEYERDLETVLRDGGVKHN